jgi:glycosyltransferase involved in cell wall biosynthesis
MKTLLYISSLPQNSQTGGANAVNYHTFKELQKHFNCTYVQINPKEPILGKLWSQLKRKILKQPGRFNFFSHQRLQQIAKEFNAIKGDFDYVFFRGFTSWVYCQPQVPYIAYNDVHFLQFFNNTFSYNQFAKKDIQRICAAEKNWLSKAKTLTFESQWGADRCLNDYQVPSKKLVVIGRGGHIPIPKVDVYDGSLNLVVIANNFYQKGGDLTYTAFKQLRSKYPTLALHIIGGHPGDEIIADKGVHYHGYLYKENTNELKQLVNILAKAFLLMHITREDVNPLVPTEAGYFGCPTVSVKHFAIPELIKNNATGLLLNYLPKPSEIAQNISHLIEEPEVYLNMRLSCWNYNRSQYSWENIGKQLNNSIQK